MKNNSNRNYNERNEGEYNRRNEKEKESNYYKKHNKENEKYNNYRNNENDDDDDDDDDDEKYYSNTNQESRFPIENIQVDEEATKKKKKKKKKLTDILEESPVDLRLQINRDNIIQKIKNVNTCKQYQKSLELLNVNEINTIIFPLLKDYLKILSLDQLGNYFMLKIVEYLNQKSIDVFYNEVRFIIIIFFSY